ncbi:MAG: M36 family metallopeptidase, partial [Ignavibacteriaceae bacterium]|nr:M36 family metallopeptidase [Ignavibacteriaceae bacterium]
MFRFIQFLLIFSLFQLGGMVFSNDTYAQSTFNIHTNQYQGTPEVIARQYLKENNPKFQADENLTGLKLLSIKESPAGHHVCFTQIFKGIPVFRSETVVSINKSNQVTALINGFKKDSSLDSLNIVPSIDSISAEQIAFNTVNGKQREKNFASKKQLIIYKDSISQFHLAWKVLLPLDDPNGDWLVIVDAHTNKVLEFGNKRLYDTGQGRVFLLDPVTYWNSLPSEPFIIQGDDSAFIDNSCYYATQLFNLNPKQSDGYYYIQGTYAASKSLNDEGDLAKSSTGSFYYYRPSTGFDEVNIYFHIDKFSTYIHGLGFSPKWDSVDAIQFDATDLYNNDSCASYYKSTDQTLRFAWCKPDTSSGYYPDHGEDQSVIIHEYGHALHDALINGGITNLNNEGSGISEGIGDYFAISYRRKLESSRGLSYYNVNNRVNWIFVPSDVNNTGIYDFPTGNYNSDLWLSSYYYDKGHVWASTLMDIEYNTATDPSAGTNIGRDTTTKLVLQSLHYLSTSSNVGDYVEAILQADRDLYNGLHISKLETVFKNRGFIRGNETITSSQTWQGQLLINGDITVSSGATLIIAPGTRLHFENVAKLIINGTLIVGNSSSSVSTVFDRFGSSGTWGGIIFNSTGFGTILYASIQHAAYGIKCTGTTASILIANSIINYNTSGIYLNNSTNMIIHDNTVCYNTHDGIDCMYSSNPVLYLNYV